MPRIGMVEMMLIDDISEKKNDRGYVLDFSNTTFARFFASELNVDIYDDAFAKQGTSKMTRLRCYLQAADGKVAAQAIKTGIPRSMARTL